MVEEEVPVKEEMPEEEAPEEEETPKEPKEPKSPKEDKEPQGPKEDIVKGYEKNADKGKKVGIEKNMDKGKSAEHNPHKTLKDDLEEMGHEPDVKTMVDNGQGVS